MNSIYSQDNHKILSILLKLTVDRFINKKLFLNLHYHLNYLLVIILNSNLNFFQFKDIQWEYPGAVEYGAAVDSKQRYTSLIKVLFFV